jgi:hypothetical protein
VLAIDVVVIVFLMVSKLHPLKKELTEGWSRGLYDFERQPATGIRNKISSPGHISHSKTQAGMN